MMEAITRCHICASCDSSSSVYSAVAAALQHQSKGWKVLYTDPGHVNAHLVLAHRNHVPYQLLGLYQGFPQLVNYYRGMGTICRKTSHASAVQQYTEETGTTFPWLLQSFVIYPTNLYTTASQSAITKAKMAALAKKDQRQQFLREYQENENKIWIAKSSAGAKGEGILVSGDAERLLQFIDNTTHAHVLQKYIESPLLLTADRKFDIRVWVLVDHNLDIYLYNEGVLRTASEPYDPANLDHVTSHLTNHCLQEKLSPNFGKFEFGNEMFFDEFNSFLQSTHGTTLDRKILPQIHSVIRDNILIIKDKISGSELAYQSFQLLGFDVMVDSDFHVWLLEINGSPACAQQLLPNLVEAIIDTVINPVFAATDKKLSPHFTKLS